MWKQLTLSLLLLCSFFQNVFGQSICNPPSGRPTCVCYTSKGLIDLTTIANNDGTPRYSGASLSDQNGYTYSYNPCYGFGIGNSGCNRDTAACQHERSDSSIQYSCGSGSSENFIINPNGNNRLEYDGGESGRTTIVTLHCDPSATTPRVTTTGDVDVYFVYEFDIYSVCACPDGCAATTPNNGHKKDTPPGVLGIVLIFLVIGGFISYFIIGAVILKFKFQKTGLDMIPQRSFWFDIPFLVKDGFLFTKSKIMSLVKRNDSNTERYESL